MASEGDKLLRLPAVLEMTGLCRSTVYSLVAAGRFPAPLKLTPRSSAWRLSEIESWASELPRAECGGGRQ